MAITLWRQRSPFEGLTKWFDDIDTWVDTGFLTDMPDTMWRPAIDIEEKYSTLIKEGSIMIAIILKGEDEPTT